MTATRWPSAWTTGRVRVRIALGPHARASVIAGFGVGCRRELYHPTTAWPPVCRPGALLAVANIPEIQSASTKSFEDAIHKGIARAEKTLRNLSGAWIKSQKVVIEKGKITEYRVLLKVTFVLQDQP